MGKGEQLISPQAVKCRQFDPCWNLSQPKSAHRVCGLQAAWSPVPTLACGLENKGRTLAKSPSLLAPFIISDSSVSPEAAHCFQPPAGWGTHSPQASSREESAASHLTTGSWASGPPDAPFQSSLASAELPWAFKSSNEMASDRRKGIYSKRFPRPPSCLNPADHLPLRISKENSALLLASWVGNDDRFEEAGPAETPGGSARHS